MRAKFIALLFGFGLLAVSLGTAAACPFHDATSADAQQPQQTAQAQLPAASSAH